MKNDGLKTIVIIVVNILEYLGQILVSNFCLKFGLQTFF